MSEETWTDEDEAIFRPLYRKYLRLKQRAYTDRTRTKEYGARPNRRNK